MTSGIHFNVYESRKAAMDIQEHEAGMTKQVTKLVR
jgi:hypothetical protein